MAKDQDENQVVVETPEPAKPSVKAEVVDGRTVERGGDGQEKTDPPKKPPKTGPKFSINRTED